MHSSDIWKAYDVVNRLKTIIQIIHIYTEFKNIIVAMEFPRCTAERNDQTGM